MTARGAALLAVGVVAIAAGVILQWPEVVAIGIALIAMLAVPLALRWPATATWQDEAAPVRVVRGDEAAVIVAVNVPSGSTRWVSAVDAAARDRVFLPAPGVCTLIWPVDTSRRGLFHVGPSRLEARDPFGISHRVLASREPSPILVVPRVHPVETRTQASSADTGDDDERSGSETFHSLREYVVGDPLKLVHWRSSARRGQLMVRRMVDTTVPWLLVVLDVDVRAYDREGALFEDFDSPAFERTVDTAASWAWAGCGPDQRVLLTTTCTDATLPMAAAAEVTARTRDSALDWLAVVDPVPSIACGGSRVEALMRRRGVGHLVLVTGRPSAASAAWVSSWRRVLPVTVIAGRE